MVFRQEEGVQEGVFYQGVVQEDDLREVAEGVAMGPGQEVEKHPEVAGVSLLQEEERVAFRPVVEEVLLEVAEGVSVVVAQEVFRPVVEEVRPEVVPVVLKREGVLVLPWVQEGAVEDPVAEVLTQEAVGQEVQKAVLREDTRILQVCCHSDTPWEFL